MGLFDSILEKLGLKKAEPPKPAAPATPRPTGGHYTPTTTNTATPAPMSAVDVVGKLEGMAKKNPMKLNWKESIVDLLVVLELPHGADDLKELAVELRCPANIVDDSFKRNMWLHKAVLKAIADNGGNIPKHMLD
jgi:pyocin large subunit-like protein